jgi:tripartite-type tricarboxylate transporter receptor subunit TctC
MGGIERRQFIKRAAAGAFAGAFGGTQTMLGARPALANDFPTRPVTLVAPWPPGGAVDVLCRAVAAPYGDRLGKSMIVENRPGAGSVIGVAAVARAEPDGYTLVMAGSAALAISVTFYKKRPYDSVKDFAPIGLVTRIPFVLVVNNALPVHNVQELIALAKSKPGELSYASGGPGSPHHLFMELFKTMTGTDMAHIPYKGSAPASTDIIAGQVPVMFDDVVVALPLIRAGKMRAIGVSSLTRFPEAPDIPTVAEQGVPGFEGVGWVMIVAPTGTPADVVGRLHADLEAVIAAPAMQKTIASLGMIAIDSPPPAELSAFIKSEIVRWSGVVEQAGLAGSI